MSARRSAVEVLRETLERGGRATALLAEKAPDLSQADGDLLRRIVLGVLRERSALDSELASASRPPLERLAPDLREILEVALYQIRYLDRVPAYAAVDEAVAHARASAGEGAAKLVNAVLRTILRRDPSSEALAKEEALAKGETAAALALRFSHPEFLVARWLQRFGEEATLRILASDNEASPLDLMVNPRATDRETLAAALEAEGIETRPSPLSTLALSVVAGNPFRSPLFAAGHFSVQDVASQALPLLLPPGERLLDLAAAPGGKSFAALALNRARRAFCLDISAGRLGMFLQNRRRLGASEALAVAGSFLAPPFLPGRFDRVLFDAPCSGTGTLRKNPEIRYRVTAPAIERICRIQENGLSVAARLLSPGGYLLYATCSLEEEENERVVERVLAADRDLERAEILAPGALAEFVSGSRFRILPGASNDGFTAHLLRKSPVARHC